MEYQITYNEAMAKLAEAQKCQDEIAGCNNELRQVSGAIPCKQSYSTNDKPSTKEKKYTLDEKRAQNGNAYLKWEDEADRLLCRLYDEGNSITLLAEMFERTRGAIRKRLIKLGKINTLYIE